MGSAHDACCTIDCAAIEVAVASFVDSGVQPAAKGQGQTVCHLQGCQSLLNLERRAQRIEGAVERGVYTIARHLDDRSVIALHRGFGNRIVTSHHRWHPLGFLLP